MFILRTNEQFLLAKTAICDADMLAGTTDHFRKVPFAHEHLLPLAVIRECMCKDEQLYPFQAEPLTHHPVLNQEAHHFLVDW